MISFVWTDPLPFYSGRGGTESFTIGHIRELQRRGIDSQILTYGHGKKDGREFFPDIVFRNLKSLNELRQIDGTVIYMNIPHAIPTQKQSFVYFHYPALREHGGKSDYKKGLRNNIIITNSRFLRSFWADFLDISETSIHVVYPFAHPAFANIKRKNHYPKTTRILFAGRLSPEKGIYTLLEALHHPIAAHLPLVEQGFSISVTSAGNETIHGQVLEGLIQAHPWVNLVKARHTPEEMAKLFAEHEIVVMPSNHAYWHEAFGMISVEAQHSGCRVVASNDGGLPETNCGELILYRAGDSFALYKAILKARRLGPLTMSGRREAVKHFTLAESTDSLLNIVSAYDNQAIKLAV